MCKRSNPAIIMRQMSVRLTFLSCKDGSEKKLGARCLGSWGGAGAATGLGAGGRAAGGEAKRVWPGKMHEQGATGTAGAMTVLQREQRHLLESGKDPPACAWLRISEGELACRW